MTTPVNILVVGGAGYIGSHTCVALLQAGYEVLVLDNLCNSKVESLRRVEAITGKAVPLVQADVRDRDALRDVFRTHAIGGVIHFAGLKAVGESVKNPLSYYDNNVSGSVALPGVMAEFGVRMLVFSSSATVYGDPTRLPIREDLPLKQTSPYGHSKRSARLDDRQAKPAIQSFRRRPEAIIPFLGILSLFPL